MIHDDFFQSTVERDFFSMFCGEFLGSGAHRDVYVYGMDPDWVVKVEAVAHSFSNVREWDIWNDAREMGPHFSEWLAPCMSISPCGIVLIQRRTKPARTLPDKVPAWMTDLKPANFGRLGKRVVAHDYGNNLICSGGLTTKLRKANWRNDG